MNERMLHFREGFSHPSIEFRPELRWWLAEGLHTDETLRREIADAHRLGFGGMEFLAMDDVGIDHTRYGWGAEEWTHDSGVVVEETTAREMSVSFTSGTNWSNANLPTITPDDRAASQELDYTIEDVEGSRSGRITTINFDQDGEKVFIPGAHLAPHVQRLRAVLAAPVIDGDDTLVINPSEIIDLTPSVKGGYILNSRDSASDHDAPSLEWTAPDSRRWRLFAFWMHGTGQTAEPSAATNVTVNYLDRDGVDAVIDYWTKVVLTPELEAEIERNPRAQMYMDSLELNTWGKGGLFWGFCLEDEFRERRGYSIIPWLPFLVRSVPMMACSTKYRYESVPERRIDVEKVRYDYVKTLTDLYIEHMLRPFATFLHEHGIALRAEISYGLPFELTRPGPEVDGIETESLEFGGQIDAYRLLAGPAHLFGKQYSSETGATSRNHMLDHRFYDQIIATQLAAGVTKTVLHGWSSPAGPEETTRWPGHEGMYSAFSERFDTRQPSSEFYPLWTEALARIQYALRQGLPRIDGRHPLHGSLRRQHVGHIPRGCSRYPRSR
ncbi:glycosyl hydrolase [Schaalia hyovaginalis]|uniref:glycosyl hydrolase n=1 Tax=Schaalia hyovaginalis TaxID=29316 RepID=UPI002A762071|nr:glycosyl hydrolase [Schaalia hyovaginalis]MDY2669188.1 glycosyl hydrolase [Schaalia hyovaginalis]